MHVALLYSGNEITFHAIRKGPFNCACPNPYTVIPLRIIHGVQQHMCHIGQGKMVQIQNQSRSLTLRGWFHNGPHSHG